MKPIPVVFHIGPLQIHTYGIGLAITFWFAYRYFARRLRAHGYPDDWLGRAFVWIIVAAIVGARVVHVLANWSFYSHNLVEVFAIWHGGLASFGGLLFGVPVGIWAVRRWCTQLRLAVALDLVSTVLVLAWSVGRLLGPQLMVRGGGYRTNAWYGMYYADQVGKRLPTPIFQAMECFVIWLVVLQVEKFVRRRGGPLGFVTTAAVSLWGLSRVSDETLLLPHGAGGDAVIGASIAFVVLGALFATFLLLRDRHRVAPAGVLGDPWAAPSLDEEQPAPGGGEAVDPADPAPSHHDEATPATPTRRKVPRVADPHVAGTTPTS